MQLQLRGYQGATARMQELKSRIEEFSQKSEHNSATGGVAGFSGLVGSISGDGKVAPMNPFQPGNNVEGFAKSGALRPMIEKAALQAGLDANLLDALVASESAYDPSARSKAGALGLTQLMPGTAQSLGVTNPMDPWQNLNGGAKYLSQMMQRYGGDIRLALAAYNAGPGAVDRHGGVPPYSETKSYVNKVLSLYEAKRAS